MTEVQLEATPAPPLVAPRDLVAVQVRKEWTDEWFDIPYLFPVNASLIAAPGTSSADLRFDFGTETREDDPIFNVCKPEDLSGHFCRILRLATDLSGKIIDRETLFWGIIEHEGIQLFGASASSAGNDGTLDFKASGVQGLRVWGLEHLLDRVPLDGSFAIKATSATIIKRDWPMPFNEGFEWQAQLEIGNRSFFKVDGPGGKAFVFSDDRAAWNHLDIVEYLISFFSPPGLQFQLAGQLDALSQLVSPRLNLGGLTIKEALNALIPVQRGLGWVVRVDSKGDKDPAIHIFTSFAKDQKVGDVDIKANAEAFTSILDDDKRPEFLEVSDDEVASYDFVIVRGARLRSMFTVSFEDATLIEGWTPSEQAAYLTATGTDPKVNDQLRSSDKFAHIFSRFLIPRSWDFKMPSIVPLNILDVLPGIDIDGKFNINAALTSTNNVDWGLLLSRSILLESEQGDSESEPELRQMFAAFQDPTDDLFHYVERAEVGGLPTGLVRPLDAGLGFEITTSPPHQVALNHFAGAAATGTQPTVDYKTILATVSIEFDQRLSVIEKISEDTVPQHGKTLVINVPEAAFWWIVPETVTDIQSGALVRHVSTAADGSDNVLRDDSEKLRGIAALAKAWYSQKRSLVRAEFRGLLAGQDYPLGALWLKVTEALEDHQVATVVTTVIYDFEQFRTSVNTGYADLDLRLPR